MHWRYLDYRRDAQDPFDLETGYNELREINESLEEVQMAIRRTAYIRRHFYDDKSEKPCDTWDTGAVSPPARRWIRESIQSGLLVEKSNPEDQLLWLKMMRFRLARAQYHTRDLINKLRVRRGRRKVVNILHLSQEILQLIFNYLIHPSPCDDLQSFSDIQSARLTCRRFHDASSHMLFESITVDLTRSSLSRLDRVSRHPFFSKGVRNVKVVLRFFEPPPETVVDFVDFMAARVRKRLRIEEGHVRTALRLSFQSSTVGRYEEVHARARELLSMWQRLKVEGVNPDAEGETRCHSKFVTSMYREYRERYDELESLRPGVEFCRAITVAMARMPRARRLEITDGPIAGQERGLSRSIFTVPKEFDFHDIYTYILHPLNGKEVTDTATRGPPVRKVVMALPGLLHRVGVRLTELDIQLSCLEKYPPPVAKSDGGSQSQTSLAISGLTQFSFKLEHFIRLLAAGTEVTRTRPKGDDLCHLLHHFLDTAASLKTIKLDMSYEDTFHTTVTKTEISIGEILTVRRWENLAHFTLRRASMHLAALRKFVDNLRQPLETLTLENIMLLSGTWEDVLDILREKGCRHQPGHILEDPLSKDKRDDAYKKRVKVTFKKDGYFRRSLAEKYISGEPFEENPLRVDRTGDAGGGGSKNKVGHGRGEEKKIWSDPLDVVFSCELPFDDNEKDNEDDDRHLFDEYLE
ncbi:hypothetical protein B0T19DRAFT_463648 [Cercophora scortea]|uniref:F-box domain-containing protein n=1 Tax=Cercophora scortea TaxID=314031 RepID=A0AAE0M9E4_9PEZI|nr:hypothetical protein B0T19DRAFT_463648 [Cercophora scortea]